MAWFPTDPHSVTPAWLSHVLGADVRACRLEQIGIGIGILARVFRVHLDGTAYRILSWLSFLRLTKAFAPAPISTSTCARRILSGRRRRQSASPGPPYFTAFDPVTHDFVPGAGGSPGTCESTTRSVAVRPRMPK